MTYSLTVLANCRDGTDYEETHNDLLTRAVLEVIEFDNATIATSFVFTVVRKP